MPQDNIQREYDVIIWGATGFTGKLVTEYMAQQYTASNLKWAIAGRSKEKLENVVASSGQLENLDVLVADAKDEQAMHNLVQQTRVVLTTVGPYARYGSELVAACAEHGTHYCDLTGEVHWMKDMIANHESAAQASGARIVHTCGFDSIPSDLGVYALQREMLATHGVPAQEIKYRTRAFKGGFSGGTIDSMMAMMESAKTNPDILKDIADPYALNNTYRGQDGLDNNQHFYDPDFSAWVGPFVMAAINTRVVRRSNELLDLMYGSDFRYSEGTITGQGAQGMLGAGALGLGTLVMNSLSALEPTRKVMQRFLPKPGEGPDEDTIENGFFHIELLGKHPSDQSKNMTVHVKGDKDPGYGSTAKMLAESAVCLAQDELKAGGGFWTPASAMGDELLDRLPANAGVTFEFA